MEFAKRFGRFDVESEMRARGLYNLAMGLEALAWIGLAKKFRRNDAHLS